MTRRTGGEGEAKAAGDQRRRAKGRVLLLAPSACLWGGVQTWVDQSARALRKYGWEVILGLTQGPVFNDPVRYAEIHGGHRVVPVTCWTGTPEGRCRAVLRVLDRERPDVLLVANVADGLEAARRWKTRQPKEQLRVAYSIHAFLPGQFADLIEYRDTVDRVLTTNRLMQRAVSELLSAGEEWIGYSAYGVEPPLAVPNRTPAAVGPLRLAWVGRIEEPQKRAADLAAVLRRCAERGTDFTCDVAGDGPASQGLREGLVGLESSGKVRFLGYVSRDELYRRVYPTLDALLLTSSWETGPIVAWEAMRHGATLVSSRYVGLNEEHALVNGANCLLAPVGDIEGLAAAIARLDTDRALLAHLAEAAQRTADGRYSLDASGDGLDRELLRTLEGQERRPAPQPVPRKSFGRLDRLFGPVVGESVRQILGLRARPRDAGDEWPHEGPGRAIATDLIERRLAEALGAPNLWDRSTRAAEVTEPRT